MHPSQSQAKQIQKAIEKSAKQVIAASPIQTSTRSGSKELAHLIKRLANQPFANLASATQVGEALGHQVVELSQKMKREQLDQGVIRQLKLLKQVPAWTAVEVATPEIAAGRMTSFEHRTTAIEEPAPSSEAETARVNPDADSNANLETEEPYNGLDEVNMKQDIDEQLDDEVEAEELDEEEDLDDEDLDDEEDLDEEEDLDDEEDLDEELDDEEDLEEEEDLDEDVEARDLNESEYELDEEGEDVDASLEPNPELEAELSEPQELEPAIAD